MCIQGGLHPDMPASYYGELLDTVTAQVPGIHIHAFSPFEIWYGSAKTGMSYKSFLSELYKVVPLNIINSELFIFHVSLNMHN